MQPGDVKESFADIDYSYEKLSFQPKVSINEGVPKFIEWYKGFYE
jgi:UDP-glucuronate 4-epimerase